MRTKTLLIAAAALAAAVTSSNAQSTVYSQNVVGYVNTVLPGGSALSLVSNPLNGTTNSANTILPALVGGESVLVWSGTGYYFYQYQGAGVGTGLGFQSDWTDNGAFPPAPPAIPGDQTDTADGVYWAPTPVLNPGQGFFVQNPGANLTNTFTGTVITTNSASIPGSGVLSLVSSAIPVGGNITTNSAINLTASLVGGESVLVWSGTGYYLYQYQGAGVGTGFGFQSDWTDNGATPPAPPAIPGDQTDTADGVYWAPTPSLTVGQGFFVQNPGTTLQWKQNINLQ